ncbi:hypothetical protein BKG77_15755 [Mycobacteroides chelonae]|nr:hypothetical protein BKG77_15755 [Mycobacteroides chelonae]
MRWRLGRLLSLRGLLNSLLRLLLRRLLLWCLVVRVLATRPLGVGGGGLIIGDLGAVGGLLPLWGLLSTLLH